jgi:hypothetical protein
MPTTSLTFLQEVLVLVEVVYQLPYSAMTSTLAREVVSGRTSADRNPAQDLGKTAILAPKQTSET